MHSQTTGLSTDPNTYQVLTSAREIHHQLDFPPLPSCLVPLVSVYMLPPLLDCELPEGRQPGPPWVSRKVFK